MAPADSSAPDPAAATAARIRLVIAADWVGLRPKGPDGRRLLAGLILWSVGAACAWAVHDQHLGPWGWAAALIVLGALGTWADRRAATRRGWVSAMERARRIADEFRQRRNAATVAQDAAPPATCPACGRRVARPVEHEDITA